MTNLHKNNSGSIVAIIVALVAITVIGAAGYVVYNKNKSTKTSTTATPTQSQQQSTTPTSNEQTAKPVNEDEQVTAAFYALCKTNPAPDGYVRDDSIGTMTPDQKKFVYSEDKTFVALNGRCGVKKADSTDGYGASMAYIFKKVNGSWGFINAAQQGISDEIVAKYQIPSEFLKAIGLD